MSDNNVRYPDKELKEFEEIINKKLDRARRQYEMISKQIKESADNSGGDNTADLTDLASSQSEIEILSSMANRQIAYTRDLESALVRVRNKTYGVCEVTGELIDKKRLFAVPTTTKSLIAKQHNGDLKKIERERARAAKRDKK